MKRRPILLPLACLVLMPVLWAVPSAGQQSSPNVSRPPEEVKPPFAGASRDEGRHWSFVLGGSYAWPKLSRANRDIHAVEAELKKVAPTVKRFEDWDDIDKGTLSAGLHRRIEWKGLVLWPNVTVAYGKGGVSTSEQNVNTVLAVPMSYRFRQDYTFWLGELGLFLEVLHLKRISVLAGGYFLYGILQSDSMLRARIPLAGTTRYGEGTFREGAFGAAAEVAFVYNLPFAERISLRLAGRYDWLRFAGPTRVSETQTTPLGATAITYHRRTVSDITGPGVFFAVAYGF